MAIDLVAAIFHSGPNEIDTLPDTLTLRALPLSRQALLLYRLTGEAFAHHSIVLAYLQLALAKRYGVACAQLQLQIHTQ